MKAVIKDIRRIANRSKDNGGDAINIVVISLSNGKSIVRNLAQFVRDLDNSGRLLGVDTDYITNVKHPAITRACTKLRGGEVEGDFSYAKAGDSYEITENSSAVNNPQHPLYGQVEVGDTAQYQSDVTIVEGFLFLAPSMKQMLVEEQAEASAQLMANLMGQFAGTTDASTSELAEDIDDAFIEGLGDTTEEDPTTEEVVNTEQTEKVN